MLVVKHKTFTDNRGDLIPIEFDQFPFIPKRLFIVKNVPQGYRRGEHAHYKTQQYLICLRGFIKVALHNGKVLDECILKEGDAILIREMMWDYQEFLTDNDVLLVVCSTKFDLNDYIGDFEEFKRMIP